MTYLFILFLAALQALAQECTMVESNPGSFNSRVGVRDEQTNEIIRLDAGQRVCFTSIGARSYGYLVQEDGCQLSRRKVLMIRLDSFQKVDSTVLRHLSYSHGQPQLRQKFEDFRNSPDQKYMVVKDKTETLFHDTREDAAFFRHQNQIWYLRGESRLKYVPKEEVCQNGVTSAHSGQH